jgi:hypothetical protein
LRLHKLGKSHNPEKIEAGGMAQVVEHLTSPEFKSQYFKKRKKEKMEKPFHYRKQIHFLILQMGIRNSSRYRSYKDFTKINLRNKLSL